MPEKYYKVTKEQLLHLMKISFTAGYVSVEDESGISKDVHGEARAAYETCLSCPITEE